MTPLVRKVFSAFFAAKRITGKSVSSPPEHLLKALASEKKDKLLSKKGRQKITGRRILVLQFRGRVVC